MFCKHSLVSAKPEVGFHENLPSPLPLPGVLDDIRGNLYMRVGQFLLKSFVSPTNKNFQPVRLWLPQILQYLFVTNLQANFNSFVDLGYVHTQIWDRSWTCPVSSSEHAEPVKSLSIFTVSTPEPDEFKHGPVCTFRWLERFLCTYIKSTANQLSVA